MTWTRGRRELCFSGRLPLEQGAVFEQAIWNIAKTQRAADKQTGTILDWQQSAADALVTLARQSGGADGGVEAQPDHPDRAPQRRRAAAARGRRAAQPRDSRAAHLRRAPPHHQAERPRPRALTRRPLRLLRPATRTAQALIATASTPAAPPPASSKHTTSSRSSAAARPNSTTSSCSAPATTNSSTTTTSTPAATPSSPPSQTKPDAQSPPTNHTHHPADRWAMRPVFRQTSWSRLQLFGSRSSRQRTTRVPWRMRPPLTWS